MSDTDDTRIDTIRKMVAEIRDAGDLPRFLFVTPREAEMLEHLASLRDQRHPLLTVPVDEARAVDVLHDAEAIARQLGA
jgi:hypothetical protein